MKPDKFIKSKDYIHLCPFCQKALGVCDNEYFKNRGQVGYECENCFVPEANTMSGKQFSRYNIGVMKNLQLGEELIEQIIVAETFYIHYKDSQWYDVSNNLIKDQTAIVLTTPTINALSPYLEEPMGLTWLGGVVILPFIDSWNPADEVGTLSKIKTYLLFL